MTESPIDSPMKRLAKLKVLIIHPAPLIRSGLVALIQATGRFVVCGETGDALSGREMFVKYQPRGWLPSGWRFVAGAASS
jgi:S-adenosylmethionine synthetase